MKRFAYAAATVALTGMLVMLAIAVAQHDSRVRDAIADETPIPYANQPAQPIPIADQSEWSGEGGDERSNGDNWPNAPIVRANDRVFPPLPENPANESSRTVQASYAGHLSDRDENSELLEPPALQHSGSFEGNSPSLPSLPASLPPPIPKSTGNSLPALPPALISGNRAENNPDTLASEPTNSPFATAPVINTSLSDQSSIPSSQSSSSSNEPPSSLPPLPSNPMPQNSGPGPVATFGTPMPADNNTLPVSTPNAGLGSSASSLSSPPSYSPSTPAANQDWASSPPANSSFNNSISSTARPSPIASNAGGNASAPSTGFFSAAPGGRQLDGSQNPSMEIQKRAPNEVQVGVPATFTLLVRNVGNATAFDVNVFDAIPKGAKLVRTLPAAQGGGANGLVWKLGEMAAGAEQIITIELIPEAEGEIGSVASVTFAAQASVRTISTQPKLLVKQISETMILGGETIRIMVEVSNVGTGTARNVRLEEDVPPNMRHTSGAQSLDLSVGDLAPGQSEKFDLELVAVSAGKFQNSIRAVSENAAVHESTASLEVVSPKLQASLEGPRLRYLERQATYNVSVTNVGTAIATNVDLVLHLPSGMQFNAAENQGEYIPNRHAVMWQLAELPAGKTATTKVTLLPVEEGDFQLRMQSEADSVRSDAIEKQVRVEGQSELTFSVEDDNDPIETDGSTTYLIKITNVGTRIDQDIQLAVELPEGSIVEQIDAPVQYQSSGRGVMFAPIPNIQPKDQQTVRMSVRHTREGTHVLRAQLKSKLRPTAVIKEESTQVYRDQ